ncbi:MAG: hypothetical protein IIV27_09590, partial [Clostridia bacterium]|nr:hypothetical protein [Clostridia bacterium]
MSPVQSQPSFRDSAVAAFRREGEFYIGRSEYDSPEVDQELIIDSKGRRLLRGHYY